MKWYSKQTFTKFMKEVKNSPRITFDDDMLNYVPLVLKISNKIDNSEGRVGVYSRNDLVQSGNVGLSEAWKKVDWDMIGDAEEPDKKLANYLSARIDGTIKRDLNKSAIGVAIPEYQIQKLKAEEIVDKLFGNWMYSFRVDDYAPGTTLKFIDVIEYDPGDLASHYNNVVLNDHLADVMLELRNKERDILKMSFGVDFDHKMTAKEIADHLGMSERGVKKAKAAAIKKLKTEANENYLKDFL